MQTADEVVPRARKEIKLSPAEEARFWSKVDKSAGPDGCWLWTSLQFHDGYGCFKACKRSFRSHRVAWTLENGQIPHDGSTHGVCVCHKCDVRMCCNPAHLFLGTHTVNMADMLAKGRKSDIRARGEAHSRAKLTDDKVKEIRSLYAGGGIYQKQLAVQFGVSRTLICFILNHKNWTHL